MNFIDRLNYGAEWLLFGGFQKRTDHLTRMYNIFGNSRVNLTTDSEVYVDITNNEYNLYRSTPELFVVINKFATMFSNGRWVVKDYKTGKVIENDPLYMLLEQPSPLMPRNLWLMSLAINYNVFGNALIIKNRGSNLVDLPTSLNFAPSGSIKINQTGKILTATDVSDIIKNYEIEETRNTYLPDEVIHFKTANLDNPVVGMSPLLPLQMAISNIRGARGFRNVNITKKGAMGILSPDGKDAIGVIEMDENKRTEIEKQFAKETHGIFDNQSPIKFAQIPVKYQNMNYPIKDSLLFEEVNEGFMRIIDAYGLNENIFSKEKGSTFANMQEGLRSAYQDAIIPFAENICFTINQSLGNFERNKYVELDYSHVSAMSKNEKDFAYTMKMKIESMEKLLQMGYSLEQAETMLDIKSSL